MDEGPTFGGGVQLHSTVTAHTDQEVLLDKLVEKVVEGTVVPACVCVCVCECVCVRV